MNEIEINKVKEYKSRIIDQHNPEEIKRMAQYAIIELKKEIKKVNIPPDFSSLYSKLVMILRKDPVSGLACMDRISDFVADEIRTNAE